MSVVPNASERDSREAKTSSTWMEQTYPRDDGFAAPSEPTAQSAQQAMTPSSSRLLSSLSLDEARPHQAKPSEDPTKTSADSSTISNEDTSKSISQLLLPSTLHRLPLELRRLCYSFAMIANEDFDREIDKYYDGRYAGWDEILYCQRLHRYSESDLPLTLYRQYPGYVPTICRTSQTMFEEAYPVFLSHTVLQVPHPATVKVLETFLDSLPGETGFKALRTLSFPRFDEFTDVSPITLANRCPGLHTLRLGFVSHTSLTKEQDVDGEATSIDEEAARIFDKTLEEMLAAYPLIEMLLSCGNLKKIVLSGWARYLGWDERQRHLRGEWRSVLRDVADWMCEQYMKLRRRPLTVECYWD